MDDISATASGNVFSPTFNDTSTWVVYKDTDSKDTKVITFADAGAPGEKYKVVIKTTTGDTINYLFTSKGSGYTGCDKSAYDGEWPGYRKIVLGSNAGFAKLLKMKMIKRSGTGYQRCLRKLFWQRRRRLDADIRSCRWMWLVDWEADHPTKMWVTLIPGFSTTE